MAPGAESSPVATPSSALKRTTSSAQNMKNQKSILGFFQKSSPATPKTAQKQEPASSPAQRASEQRGGSSVKKTPSQQKRSFSSFAQDLTPVPSSDLPVPEEDEEDVNDPKVCFHSIVFHHLNVDFPPTQQAKPNAVDDTMSPSRRVCDEYANIRGFSIYPRRILTWY